MSYSHTNFESVFSVHQRKDFKWRKSGNFSAPIILSERRIRDGSSIWIFSFDCWNVRVQGIFNCYSSVPWHFIPRPHQSRASPSEFERGIVSQFDFFWRKERKREINTRHVIVWRNRECRALQNILISNDLKRGKTTGRLGQKLA